MSDLAIDARNIVKRYEHHTAVESLSLAVPRGTVYGLLGPNGAGKTTTIRMLLNILQPDEGTITVLGMRSDAPALVDRVGYLPEERGLYRKMQVRRVLRFLGQLKGLAGADLERRIDAWLERMDLRTPSQDWGKAAVDELSRGMQQKVQFIAALLHDPELVILDEPFSGLDPVNAQTLKDTVMQLRQLGRTVIFSTHIMENAERMCDAVCIIARGTKVLDGSVSAVREAHGEPTVQLTLASPPTPAVSEVFRDTSLVRQADTSTRAAELQLAAGVRADELLSRLVLAGARIERFELVRPSLHRIFLERVGATEVEQGMSGHG